jgi:phosphomannomutase
MRQTLKVSVSGVRGVVGETFTPQLAAAFAQAFGVMVGNGAVVVGRDTRPSGFMIQQAVTAGLQSVGCRPLLAGVVPTPTLLMLTPRVGALGGIAITASHNPAPWNALKFVGREGLFLNEAQAAELFDIYHQQDFPLVAEGEIPIARNLPKPFALHRDRVLGYVEADRIRKRGFKVAMDCCNGVGAVHSVSFLRDGLGCDVTALYEIPSGLFEREPEPAPSHLGALCRAVTNEGCDVGFAQDPDGDRLTIVDEKGRPLGEDLTLAFAVRRVLARHPGTPVAVNLATSKVVDLAARGLGSDVVRTPIGEINVSQTMLAIGATIGGESNGGVIVPEIHPCRDSYTAMALVLELMAVEGVPVSELRSALPSFAVVREKIPARPDQVSLALRALRRRFAGEQLDLTDGIHVDLGDRWVHIRRSNTEPVIRVTAEAPVPQQARELVCDVHRAIDQVLS